MRLHNLVSMLLRDSIDGSYPLFRCYYTHARYRLPQSLEFCGPFSRVNRSYSSDMSCAVGTFTHA